MSTAKLKHIILTRYALRPSGDLQHTLDAGWFERRLRLFRNTAGSLDRQTCKAFTWLIFCSPEHEQSMQPVDDLLLWLDIDSWMCVVDGPWENFDNEMRVEIADHVGDHTHVLTTRIDNDDLIAEDFVEILQRHAREYIDAGNIDRVFFNFNFGRNLQDGKYVEHTHPSNMFLSVLEPVNDCLGILSWGHNDAPGIAKVIQLRDRDRWTHVMHGDNVWPVGRKLPEDPSKRLLRH